MINLKGVHVVFHPGEIIETHALRGIDLTIKTGEFVTVIGSNGSGKSTLLNVLSGEVPISEGAITVNDKEVHKLPVHKRAKFISRVFQDPLLGSCADLTIEENMILAYNRGNPNSLLFAQNEDSREIFKKQLSRLNLGLEDRLKDKIGQLSGGQRQAVSLLMASLRPSEILLLDEHTAALDPKTAEKVLNLTCELISEGQGTALMVTHSMRQALENGSRTIMLHQGKIVFDVNYEEKAKMKVTDLLDLFSKNQGEEISDDKLLLGT